MAYTFQPVAIPGATSTQPGGINDQGQISGSFTAASGDPYPQAFIMQNGTVQVTIQGDQHAYGFGINNGGELALHMGHYNTTSRGYLYHSDTGTYDRIAANPDGDTYTIAFGVNNSGVVAGAMSQNGYPAAAPAGSVGILWQNGSIIQTLTAPSAVGTVATGVNDNRIAAGFYTTDGGHYHGYTEANGQFSPIDVPGAQSTQIMAINDSDTVAGSYFDGAHWHGFIDTGGQMQFIDEPGAADTHLTGINSLGDVTGYTGDQLQSSGFVARDQVATLVREFYQGGLGRDADPGGLNFWTNELKTGALTPRDFVFAITGSSEGQARYGQQTDGQYVDSIYANALGRQSDPGGHAAWTNLLQSGCARPDVMAAITQSPEGQQHFMLSHA